MFKQWKNPYSTTRTPVFARNIVSTSQPLAAQAGLRVLQAGGNAVDAAIAAAAALTIVEPVSCGLGSDAFAIVWDGKTLHGLDAAGTAPAEWSTNYYKAKYGTEENFAKQPQRGWDTVTVPGAVSAWAALHSKFGKLPLLDALAPAIDIAERGYAVSPMVAQKWAAAIPELESQPGFAEVFMPRGRSPRPGECFKNPAAAKTLFRIGETKGRDFYEGESAERTIAYSQKFGGSLQLSDLRSYQVKWIKPISIEYRGYDVFEIPPSGQGIAALMALGILKHFDLEEYSSDSIESLHLQIEAMKLAFSDVYAHVADLEHMKIGASALLDEEYLRGRAKLIDRKRASLPRSGFPRTGGTVYLAVADESGMMVSFIQSNYQGFGSGVVDPSTGISFQNRGCGFSMDPASPNVVGPGKRPFHTIIPGFLMRNGVPAMSFGVMGGDMQPQGHVQTLIRMLNYGQHPQAACDAPRWKVNHDFSLDLEPSLASPSVEGLKNLGHQLKSIEDTYMDFGSGQFIWRLTADDECGYVAASDTRRDGQAVGF
jgi:gamma-glutamyltranspeptidase/glutathione hydrolase